MSIFSINRIIIAGNTTREAELRYTQNGTAVATFGMATNRSIKDGDNYKDVPTFHNVVVWGRLGEIVAQQLHKGKLVIVEGRQENRRYEDKEGKTRYVSEVVADKVIYPRTKTAEQGEETQEPAAEDEIDVPEDFDKEEKQAGGDEEDIPF